MHPLVKRERLKLSLIEWTLRNWDQRRNRETMIAVLRETADELLAENDHVIRADWKTKLKQQAQERAIYEQRQERGRSGRDSAADTAANPVHLQDAENGAADVVAEFGGGKRKDVTMTDDLHEDCREQVRQLREQLAAAEQKNNNLESVLAGKLAETGLLLPKDMTGARLMLSQQEFIIRDLQQQLRNRGYATNARNQTETATHAEHKIWSEQKRALGLPNASLHLRETRP